MQPVATSLYNLLESVTASNPRDLTWLFEFYEPDVLPTADGFDPEDASQRFASIEYTWLGLAYRRLVLSAGSISKAKGAQASRCTLRLSNADEDRYAATWVTQTRVEGMRLVVRLISRSASTTLAESALRFSGRCDKPEGFDTIQGSISATEDVGGDDVDFPPRLYLADDPEGRSPADPLNEGFPFLPLSGTFQAPRAAPDKQYSSRDIRRYVATLPYSSYDDTPLNEPIPMILGRSQIRMNRGLYVDEGRVTKCLDFACMGPIAAILYFRMNMDADYARFFAQPQSVTYHYGEAGGTGTQVTDPLWPNHPLFSYTAYITYNHVYIGTGAFTNIDAGQETIATILGLTMDLPDASGVFNQTGWSDNGAYQVRRLLTGERFFGLDPAFIEDPACFTTGQYNDTPLVDESNSGLIYIPDPDAASAGVRFLRYRATGEIGVRRARHVLGLDADRPEERDAPDVTPFDPTDPPLIPVDVRRLIKRFTTNVLLRKRIKAKDFLYKTHLPSFRGFLVMNYRGRWDIRSERPADFAHLRSTASVAATTILVEDATPWKATGGLWGQVLTGAGKTTSEVRKVLSAAYTTDANGITLAAGDSGDVTATASGGTLAGGSSSAQATGTITIGGSPDVGDTVTVTIQGIAVVYTVESSETTATVAYMVAMHINANTQLRRFVSASASGAVVTISSKWGVLTLSSALANSHTGPVANPTTAPAGLSASGSGSSLLAGDYRVVYANRNANGSTYVTPYTTVTITAGQQINIPALAFPAGVTSRDWFVSKGANDPEIVLHTNDATALGFAITAPPSSTADFPPEYNTTGEELVRVAMPFASNNQTAAILAQANLTRGNIFGGTYKWPGNRGDMSFTEIVGNYISVKDDYVASKVIVKDKALKERLGRDAPKELDLTAVDNFHQARRLTYFEFSRLIDHNWFNTLGGNGTALLLEEGDVTCASDDSGGHVNILTTVEEFSIDLPNFTVSIGKARLYSTQMFRELVPRTNPIKPSVLRWVTTLDTEIQFLDLPAWSNAVFAAGGLPFAVRRSDGIGAWKGAGIYVNTGGGYSRVLDIDVEATMGEAVTNLPADSVSVFNEVDEVRVTVYGGKTLSDATEPEVLAGANLARIGARIFAFKTATLFAEDATPGSETKTYDLGGLLVGLYDTAGQTSDVGDEFTLLDGAIRQIPLDATLVGTEIKVKAVTVNQDVADAAEHTLTWAGESLKYNRPGAQASRNATSGDWRFLLTGDETEDPATRRFKLEVVGGSTFIIRPATPRPVSLVSAPSPIFDPAGGFWNYETSDMPGNSVTADVAYVQQKIVGERTIVSFTYRTELDEDSADTGQADFGFACGGLNFFLSVRPQTDAQTPFLQITDNAHGSPLFEDLSGEASGTRYSAEFRDGKVHFYRNRSKYGTPFYSYAPGAGLTYPIEPIAFASATDTTWADIEIQDDRPALLYTAEQQVIDFGSAQTSLTVRANQQRVIGGVIIDGRITEATFP